MRSFMVCMVLAVCVIQLVRGQDYAAPTESYSYDYSKGYGGSSNVSTGVCDGIVKHLGIPGGIDYMNDYIDGGSDLNCFTAFNAFIVSFVRGLKAGLMITLNVDGTVSLIGGVAGTIGGTVTGVFGGALDLTAGAYASITVFSGGLIGGVLGGVSGPLTTVINQLNILIRLSARVRYSLDCAGSSRCQGYTNPSYA